MRNRVFLCVMALALAARTTAGPLSCPDSPGLCSWDEKAGWRLLWEPKAGPSWIHGYWTTKNGAVVVRLIAHNADGRIVVLTPQYEVVALRELGDGSSVSAVSGETPSGAVVLCQSTIGEGARCDSQVAPAGETVEEQLYFPPDCLYPRYLRNGAVACVSRMGEPALLVNAGHHFEPAVGLRGLDDVRDVLPYRDGLLVWTDTSLYVWEAFSSIREIGIEAKRISDVMVYGDDVFILSAFYDWETQSWSAGEVLRANQDSAPTVVWSSKEFLPRNLIPRIPNGLLLDVADPLGVHRQLIWLSEGQRVIAKKVWQGSK